MALTVSIIDYLNAVPLSWMFTQNRLPGLELLFDTPAECAHHLESGEADVGLIPIIEFQRIPGLNILPGISIASKREVKSVLFVSRKPLLDISIIAVDSASRTSVALLKILLHKFFRIGPLGYHPMPADPGRMLRDYDAALIIGNPALQVPQARYYVYDLAYEWYRFTGLPFVFAVWAVRAGVSLSNHLNTFYESRRRGLEAVDEIASIYAPRLGLTVSEVRHYLLENLDYSLDATQILAMETFFHYCQELDLIEEVRPLRFYGESQPRESTLLPA